VDYLSEFRDKILLNMKQKTLLSGLNPYAQ